MKISGRGLIFIDTNALVDSCSFILGDSKNVVEIGEGVKLHGVEFILRHGGENKIIVGPYTTIGGSTQIEASEGNRVVIGKDCMFSHHIKIFTTDGHSILDMDGKRINYTRGVVIGNHVWVGNTVMIMKGSCIPSGSIIGANSLVCSSSCSEENSIYAGNPAKLVKKNIQWIRELI